jgi:hypothetical protein
MPTVHIIRTPPIPEGEYAGTLTNVNSGFTQQTNEARFTYNIKMKDGRVIRDTLYFRETVNWRIENLAKSANLILPENHEETGFILTPDDLEGRVVYFGVKHNHGENGRVFQNVNFHTLAFAIQQNSALAGMYPPQAPLHLRAASPDESPLQSDGTTAPLSSPPPAPVAEADDDTLTPEEFAQALEQARRKRTEGKQAA